jgi:transcriptional regulator GlxA family with amidase domain
VLAEKRAEVVLELADAGDGIEVDREARFVDTGDVVTAAGVPAGIDMALHLVARLDSVDQAQSVRRYIQYDSAPPV